MPKGINYTNPLNGQKSNTYKDAMSIYKDYGGDSTRLRQVRGLYERAANTGSSENRRAGKDLLKHLDSIIASGGKKSNKSNTKGKTKKGKGKSSGNKGK